GTKFGDLDVIVEGTMQLNDREFNMDTNTVTVINADTASVKNTSGFVSSLQNGGLSRHTAFAAGYFYPVGSSRGTLRYRPVYITPNSSAQNIFKTRMANVDASAEGFDRNVRQPVICEINPFFYHRIFHISGNDAADLLITYQEPQDGQYSNIVHWQNIPWWGDAGTASYTPGLGGLSSLKISGWNDFSYSPFALANVSPLFDVNNNQEIICDNDTVRLFVNEDFIGYQFFVNGVPVQNDTSNVLVISTLNDGDTITVIGQDSTCIAYSRELIVDVYPLPTAYAGEDTTVYIGADVQLHGEGGMDYQWTPDSSLTCGNCPDPLATVFETTPYTLIVSDGYGCKDADTVVIIVDEDLDPRDVLFIPNAITPNGDGVNETWNIRNIDLYPNNDITILNRWGDVIYSSAPYLVAWDGTYKGTPVPDGTYYYLIKLKDVNKTLNGPLTVVR
ncbi:MAG TPA: gliding motility-associated C-terminal domain-containing protein, partial [Chitinophagales bacterium]|nr:gliding motility-associated C-terminal domain-containing protein [Chitinophagales bacterium]